MEAAESRGNLPTNDIDSDDEHNLDPDEWKDEFKDVLDYITHEGDFCMGKDITNVVPRYQPSITVDGLDDNEPLAFPLPSSQAKMLRSVAEKAPFGKGLDTVLDESVRKAWQIDADKVHFGDADQWQSILNRIVSNAVSSLGMSGTQKSSVKANLYKMLLYEEGGFFKKHKDTEKEKGMFGTLIIQMPSKFTGGALVIEHAGVRKKYDFSPNSREGIFATAFYADCEHELLPVESGWRLCLAYNLVMTENASNNPLPTASAVTAQQQQIRGLTSNWTELFDHPLGYMLEHNYTETNLHFANLNGRDREVVEFLRGCRDQSGDPLFVVCMMLIEKHESGMPDAAGYGYGYRHRSYYDDSDSGSDAEDHTMGEIHDTQIRVMNWVGPDDKVMGDFRLNFDIEYHLLLGGEDSETIFGEDPTSQDYESYTGNAGPTLDYWYHVASVVFWPRSMNMKVMKSAGDSYVVSYLNVALSSEIAELGEHIVKLVERRKLQMSSHILSGLCKANDEGLVLRALKCCKKMPSSEYARTLALLLRRFDSAEINAEVLQVVKNTAAAKNHHAYSSDTLTSVIDFMEALGPNDSKMLADTRESIIAGATSKVNEVAKSTKLDSITKYAIQSKAETFEAFCDAVKASKAVLPPILKSFVLLGDVATTHPQVIELAIIRVNTLKSKTLPTFSWKMPNAVFPGSLGAQVNSFLRGTSQSETFYGFDGIGHARNWSSKYFGGISRGGYSAVAREGGRGRDAYVTVTKTRALHDAEAALYTKQQKELKELSAKFGDRLNVDSSDESDEEEEEDAHKNQTVSSWSQPDADFPGSNAEEVNDFFHGEEKCRVFHNFHDLRHAENWANKYFDGGHGQGSGYSATAVAGPGPYVTVTKTQMNSDDEDDYDDRPYKRYRNW